MSEHFEALVIGGGVIGLTAAIGMKQFVDNIALLDAGDMTVDENHFCPRVYAFNQASEKLFKKLGVWQMLAIEKCQPYQGMKVFDAMTEAKIEFDAKMMGTHRLGYIIEESVLKKALLSKARELSITFLTNQAVTAVKTSAESVFVKSHEHRYQADLLLIADGAQSKTRALLNVSHTEWSYHQQAIVTRVEVEKPHQDTAWQVFNPDGPLAFLPLADKHQCSIVWSTTNNRAKNLMKLNDHDFNQAIKAAFQSRLGACRVLDKRIHFPLTMRHVNQYVGERWLLLGDAAHTIHPLAGLGLNLGLEDVDTWLKLIEKYQLPIDNKSLLGKYQRHRKHAVWKIIWVMQGLKSIFSTKFTPVSTIRGFGLQVINRTSFIKKFFVRQASGIH